MITDKIIEEVLKDKETSNFGVVAKLDDGFSIVLKKKLKLALSKQKAEIIEIIRKLQEIGNDGLHRIYYIEVEELIKQIEEKK